VQKTRASPVRLLHRRCPPLHSMAFHHTMRRRPPAGAPRLPDPRNRSPSQGRPDSPIHIAAPPPRGAPTPRSHWLLCSPFRPAPAPPESVGLKFVPVGHPLPATLGPPPGYAGGPIISAGFIRSSLRHGAACNANFRAFHVKSACFARFSSGRGPQTIQFQPTNRPIPASSRRRNTKKHAKRRPADKPADLSTRRGRSLKDAPTRPTLSKGGKHFGSLAPPPLGGAGGREVKRCQQKFHWPLQLLSCPASRGWSR